MLIRFDFVLAQARFDRNAEGRAARRGAEAI
jgi:hypothetical protein